MKYNDYPDKYPSQIIEKLNLAYKNNEKVNALAKDFNENFFKVSTLEMVDKTVEIASEKKCKLEGELINLIESLNKCEGFLREINSIDKNKNQVSGYIEKTINNKIEIANCCYNKNDIDCNYYATCSPSFSACCTEYCLCEVDVIEQLLCLCSNRWYPLNRNVLLNLLFCRLDCLKGIIFNYSIK